MGQHHSTDNHQSSLHHNLEAIIRDGANIERIDGEGRTPLISACLKAEFYMFAKTLIELGANVNAYQSHRPTGTPLHHAATKGLVRTVKLLLSNGANAFILNEYSQTPLEVARTLKYSNVVRTIENHISLFCGWMRDFSDSISDELLISKKVWVVVSPSQSAFQSPPNSLELELSIYFSLQDSRPRLILSLSKANMKEPNFHEKDPKVVLTYVSTSEQLKFGSAKIGDFHQLEWFCNSCKGFPQEIQSTLSNTNQIPIIPPSAPPVPQNFRLSIPSNNPHLNPISSIYDDTSNCNWTFDEGGPSTFPNITTIPSVLKSTTDLYPLVITDPHDFQDINTESTRSIVSNDVKENRREESSCVICENGPVEGACVPCGHMVGCMTCLEKIKKLNLGCPICRKKIDQILKLFAV